MKKSILNLGLVLVLALSMSSCYTYTYTVGSGPQTGIKTEERNHYFIAGLVQGNQSNPQTMAGDAENYRVTTEHTFIDGLLNIITFGIYTPTTTVVEK